MSLNKGKIRVIMYVVLNIKGVNHYYKNIKVIFL